MFKFNDDINDTSGENWQIQNNHNISTHTATHSEGQLRAISRMKETQMISTSFLLATIDNQQMRIIQQKAILSYLYSSLSKKKTEITSIL